MLFDMFLPSLSPLAPGRCPGQAPRLPLDKIEAGFVGP